MKKFDKGYVFSSLITFLFSSFVISASLIGSFLEAGDGFLKYVPYIAVFFALIYIFQVIYAILYVHFSGYQLDEKGVRCKRGVLFRRESFIEYSRIHTVNKNQSLIRRLFGVATLLVDSGSANTAFSAEIIIVEKNEVVLSLMREIRLRQGNFEYTPPDDTKSGEGVFGADVTEEYSESLYDFSSKRKILYSVLNMLAAVAFVILLSLLALAAYAIIGRFTDFMPDIAFSEAVIFIITSCLMLMLLCSVFGLIGSICASFVAFYDFKIYKRDNCLEISYGLFTRNTNSFMLDRIKAVKISESPIKRIFGFASVSLEVVGYGAENNNDKSSATQRGILFPLCETKKVSETLHGILPDYVPQEKQARAKSYLSFVLWRFYAASLFLIPAVSLASLIAHTVYASEAAVNMVVSSGCLLVVLVYAFIFVCELLAYRNNGISISQSTVSVYSGGLCKVCTVIKKRDIIAVEDITTPLRAKKGIYSFKIHFYSNFATNVATVRCLDAELVEKLRTCISL